ncbi:MAG: peptidase [Cyanobacteria bacterium RYN_339]|nr:peptidase [Cyanobacteria bacterium RYN_339]
MTTATRDFTPPNVDAAYQAVVASLPAADAPADAWLAAFGRWNELKRWVDGETVRRRFREAQDTRDEAAREANRVVREAIDPLVEPHEAHLRAAFLAAACRPAMAEALGEQLFVRYQTAQDAYEPANIPLRVQEGQIVADYMRLLASASFDAGGEALTLSQGTARLTDPDTGRRRAAWTGVVGWMEAHAEEFHGIYDRLTAVRHEMAGNLGEATFVPLAYRRMDRSDYGPAEVAAFREEIRTHVVPVMARLRAWQARELGVAVVPAADVEFLPGVALPADVAPVDTQLTKAQQLFDRLDPRMAAHFRRMVDRGLIDLPSRPGKATGAFCSNFEDTAEAAIFCNSTGGVIDVITLIHEMGHAIQVWESMPLPAMDLRWPGMDAAEVLSMGLELLALPEMEVFFGQDVERFRRIQLVTVLNRLPYMAVVDAFQHWVYEHPGHTHGAREAAWDDLWRQFMPGVDYQGQHRTRWMRQLHLFKYPFYYIDYALAECGALQLWELARTDHKAAMDAFMALCALGGTKPLVAFFEGAGLRSPFTPGLLGPLMERVAAELGI